MFLNLSGVEIRVNFSDKFRVRVFLLHLRSYSSYFLYMSWRVLRCDSNSLTFVKVVDGSIGLLNRTNLNLGL